MFIGACAHKVSLLSYIVSMLIFCYEKLICMPYHFFSFLHDLSILLLSTFLFSFSQFYTVWRYASGSSRFHTIDTLSLPIHQFSQEPIGQAHTIVPLIHMSLYIQFIYTIDMVLLSIQFVYYHKNPPCNSIQSNN